MSLPRWLVASVRAGWHWQWLQLMGGLGPADRQGNYRRPASAVPEAGAVPASADEAGRHWLVIGRSCPWAHRVWLVWSLRGLGSTLTLAEASPDLRGGRWILDPPRDGFSTLADLYRAHRTPRQHRPTVPVLLDRIGERVLCNDSAGMMDLLNRWPAEPGSIDLDPPDCREASQRWRLRLQDTVNDGVYRCGFARCQSAYEQAHAELMQALESADRELSQAGPWLCGASLTLADLCLFTTLIRWELVYEPLFGCSGRPLWSFSSLYRWRAALYNLPEVRATCDGAAWRQHYFAGLFPLNPGGIVPLPAPLEQIVTGMSAPAPARP
ncbi:glutathione S-transferase family protein [Synechococcus sp. RSCCF101]|uniref:glutathione S-transferase C-terminal domain-containing protein n=1 Tax=Synechococcus sp. RSCCF101 TaxID=2511069 RepID=UPI0012453219|nr:glutathione S-transferase C-terminal domain-containing protein [Synechococcus sp. RSCCF101]QEY33070.1 glutathione S-transferase family protein [Synechococcus sp. RSCCF101]